MTPANYKPFNINEIPDCRGKQVYLKIMNTPKVDFDQIRKQAKEYENKLTEKERLESIL